MCSNCSLFFVQMPFTNDDPEKCNFNFKKLSKSHSVWLMHFSCSLRSIFKAMLTCFFVEMNYVRTVGTLSLFLWSILFGSSIPVLCDLHISKCKGISDGVFAYFKSELWIRQESSCPKMEMNKQTNVRLRGANE